MLVILAIARIPPYKLLQKAPYGCVLAGLLLRYSVILFRMVDSDRPWVSLQTGH